ncbi:hypothetical protein M5D96_001476, partial [Drosophila gunungcola]
LIYCLDYAFCFVIKLRDDPNICLESSSQIWADLLITLATFDKRQTPKDLGRRGTPFREGWWQLNHFKVSKSTLCQLMCSVIRSRLSARATRQEEGLRNA